VPRKTKIEQDLNVEKSAARRTAQKAKKTPARKKRQITGAARTPAGIEATQVLAPSDEQIRLRAYFISERRRRFALSGDANSDWLEAKRQLLSESDRR